MQIIFGISVIVINVIIYSLVFYLFLRGGKSGMRTN